MDFYYAARLPFRSHLSELVEDEDEDPDVEHDLGPLVLPPEAEEHDVGVEPDQAEEGDARARVLDHRRPVEHVQLLELRQLAAVVAQAALGVRTKKQGEKKGSSRGSNKVFTQKLRLQEKCNQSFICTTGFFK